MKVDGDKGDSGCNKLLYMSTHLSTESGSCKTKKQKPQIQIDECVISTIARVRSWKIDHYLFYWDHSTLNCVFLRLSQVPFSFAATLFLTGVILILLIRCTDLYIYFLPGRKPSTSAMSHLS